MNEIPEVGWLLDKLMSTASEYTDLGNRLRESNRDLGLEFLYLAEQHAETLLRIVRDLDWPGADDEFIASLERSIQSSRMLLQEHWKHWGDKP